MVKQEHIESFGHAIFALTGFNLRGHWNNELQMWVGVPPRFMESWELWLIAKSQQDAAVAEALHKAMAADPLLALGDAPMLADAHSNCERQQLDPVPWPAKFKVWMHPSLEQHFPQINGLIGVYPKQHWEAYQAAAGVTIEVAFVNHGWIDLELNAPTKGHFLVNAYLNEDNEAVLWWAKRRNG